MKLINAKKHFTNKDIVSFKEGLDDETLVDILLEKSNTAMQIKLSNLRNFFTDESVEPLITEDNDTISFIANDICLQIAGQDYKWYTATVRNTKYARLDKLFDTSTVKEKAKTVKVKEVDVSKYIKIACCTMNTSNITDNIKTFEGTKQQCVAFMNYEYSIREIRHMFNESTRFSFDYQGNNTVWKTLDELSIEGAIEL